MNTAEFDIKQLAEGVHVFSSNYCVFCRRAKTLLDELGVNYQEINVDGQSKLRAVMSKAAGRTSVPQIWIHGHHVGGCDDLYALHRQGELVGLLAKIS